MSVKGASAFLSSTHVCSIDASDERGRCTLLQTVTAAFQNHVEIGFLSQGGSDPARPQKVNQDSYFMATLMSQGDMARNTMDRCYTCAGVLDGHGLKGHLVSQYFAQQLPLHLHQHLKELVDDQLILLPRDENNIRPSSSSSSSSTDNVINMVASSSSSSSLPSSSSWMELEEQLQRLSGLSAEELAYHELKPVHDQAMIRAFHSVHWASMQHVNVPAGRNGATCVMVLLDHGSNELHVAYVGDSRVIQVAMLDEVVSDSKNVEVLALSQETTIKMESERERVKAGGGYIRGNNVFYGPVGIAMTRSLGNAALLRAGVVPTPITKTFPLLPNATIVLGTDGIWDVLTNHAVAELLVANPNVQTACDEIARVARSKWVGDLPIVDEEKVDDITIVLLRPL